MRCARLKPANMGPFNNRLWQRRALRPDRFLGHPVNSRGKLGIFGRYGINQQNWMELHDSFLMHAKIHPVSDVVASNFGTKYIVSGVLNTPSGRQALPVVTAVWQQDIGETGVRFITAYPT